jgi:predicted aspartyl protease
MPILHIQYNAFLANPQGQQVAIDPRVVLQQRGPVIQVTISLAQASAQTLLQGGKTAPAPVSGLALIDTGASDTCIDNAAAQTMGLPVIDVVTITSATHVNEPCNVYPISIEVAGVPIVIEAPRVLGANLAAQGLLLLIGRNVLQSCNFIYNGVAGTITLSA